MINAENLAIFLIGGLIFTLIGGFIGSSCELESNRREAVAKGKAEYYWDETAQRTKWRWK